MGRYLTEITKQNATSIYESQAGVDVPNVTLNSEGITYTNNNDAIIAYTFTWYDKFIELDEETTSTWKYGLYDDPTDGKTKYILLDTVGKHIKLLADGESYIWLVKIPKATLENSSYTFNAFQNLPTNLANFYHPDYVGSYIYGINDGCYTWDANVQYIIDHPIETYLIYVYQQTNETYEEAKTRLLNEWNNTSQDEKWSRAENYLKSKASTFYRACNEYASTPEDQELYCKICLQGVWHDRENSSVINQNYRNTELVSCINFITSNVASIHLNNVSSYRNCSKLIFNDNIETLKGFGAGASYFSYIHLPKHLKNFEGGSFSYAKGGGIADGHEEPSLFIDFGDELENIPESMFNNGEVIKISMKLPKALKTIGNGAFFWYNSDEQLFIPASVTSIGSNAFAPGTHISYTITDRENREFILNDDFRIASFPSVKFEGSVPPYFGAHNFDEEIDSENPITIFWKEDTGKSYDSTQTNKITATYSIYVPRGSKAAYIEALHLNNPSISESRIIEYDPE